MKREQIIKRNNEPRIFHPHDYNSMELITTRNSNLLKMRFKPNIVKVVNETNKY